MTGEAIEPHVHPFRLPSFEAEDFPPRSQLAMSQVWVEVLTAYEFKFLNLDHTLPT